MICLECKKTVRAIVYKHLQSCCGLSVKEYKIKHNVSKIADDDVLDSYACKNEDNGHWKGLKFLKWFCKKCNKPLKRRRKKTGLCASCFKHAGGELNGFYNKKHSLESRNSMKMNHYNCSGENNSFFNKKHSDKTLQIMHNTHVENWKNYSEEKKGKILNNWIYSSTIKHSKTSIEEKVNLVLQFLGMKENKNYERNIQISKYNVDFLINNKLIIDCFGDYWHKNPMKYSNDAAKTKQQKDLERSHYLESKGYKFIYFWECEINNDIIAVTNKIIIQLQKD